MPTRARIPKRPLAPTPDLTLRSPSFEPNERIPARCTADGDNLSPALHWGDLPRGARSLAILVEDPDAPTPEPYIHWLIADIDPETVGTGLGQGVGAIAGSAQGRNSLGRTGYDRPAPPRGHGTHHYYFRVYAFDAPLGLSQGFTKADLLRSMRGHLLAAGELIGTYSR